MSSKTSSPASPSDHLLTVSQPDNGPRDCLACRVVGSAALGTVGVYALHMARAHQPGSVLGKRIMAGVGVVFLGLSVFRAAGDPRERCVVCVEFETVANGLVSRM
jgi:hypothetical protein